VGRLSRIETGHPFSMAGQHSPGRPDGFPSVAGLPRAGRGGLMAERTLASRARSLAGGRRPEGVGGWDAALPQGPGELWGQQRRERRFSETVRHSRLTSVSGANFAETGQRGTTVPSHYIWSGVSLVTCGGPAQLRHRSSGSSHSTWPISGILWVMSHSIWPARAILSETGQPKLRGSLLSMDDRTRPAYRAAAAPARRRGVGHGGRV
jgi:hypothetical protein